MRAGACVSVRARRRMRARVCAPERVRGERGAHTVMKRWLKSHYITNDLMLWTHNWLTIIHSKKLLFDAVDHRVRSFLKEGHNQVLNLVAMLLGHLVLGMLN